MPEQHLAPVEAAPPPAPLSHRQVLVIFSGLMLGMFLAALDQTIVATALPTIVGDLGGLNHLSWVVTAYLLAFTASTPLYGRLGDLWGRKRLYQVAILIFFVGSVLCGIATTMGQLIAFRAIQGVGGGGLLVLAQAIVGDVVSPRERGRYQGYFGAVFGTASVAGPLVGGFLTDSVSWRWVFYVNLPLAAVALVVTTAVLPATASKLRGGVDYLGSLLLTAAITCVVLVTTWGGSEHAWGSPLIVGLAVLGAVLVAAFIVVEHRAAEPVLPLRLFSNSVVSVSCAVSFILGTALFAVISYLPLFLQVVGGASATNSGLLIVPLMFGLVGASVVSGLIITRTGRYRPFPIVGTAVATFGMFLLSTMGESTSGLVTIVYMAVFGAGVGLVMQVLVLAAQNAVSVADLGVATSSVAFFRSVGGSVGVALFGTLFNARLADQLGGAIDVDSVASLTPETLRGLADGVREVLVDAFAVSITDVFLYAVPVVACAFVLSWALVEIPLRLSTHPDDPARNLSVGVAPGVAEPDAPLVGRS